MKTKFKVGDKVLFKRDHSYTGKIISIDMTDSAPFEVLWSSAKQRTSTGRMFESSIEKIKNPWEIFMDLMK